MEGRQIIIVLIGIGLLLFNSNCSLITDTHALPMHCDPKNKASCPAGYICIASEKENSGKCIKSCVSISQEYDRDNDGFPSFKITEISGCEAFCLNRDNCDCNDEVADVNPKAIEKCDMLDNDCDGKGDENFDKDGDNYFDCTIPECYNTYFALGKCDCNDEINTINPKWSEICNGIDDNCNGEIDEGEGLCPAGHFCAGSRGCLLQNQLCEKDEDCPNITQFKEDCPQPGSCVCVKGACYPKRRNLGEVCLVERQCSDIGLHCIDINVTGVRVLTNPNENKLCSKPCCSHLDCSNEGFCLKGSLTQGLCIPRIWIDDSTPQENYGVEEICGESIIRDDFTFGYSIDGSKCNSGYCAFSGSLCNDQDRGGFCSICISPCCSNSDCNGTGCNFIYQDKVEILLLISINIPVHIDTINGKSSFIPGYNYPSNFSWGTDEITAPVTACVHEEDLPDLIPCCSSRQCPQNMQCNIDLNPREEFSSWHPVVCMDPQDVAPQYKDRIFCCNDTDCNSGEACLPERIDFQYVWVCKTLSGEE